MRIVGQVIRKRFAEGSKSQHDAVFLVSQEGQFKLRLRGGNPFHDPGLDTLIGKSISAEGDLDRVSNQFFVTKWTELSETNDTLGA